MLKPFLQWACYVALLDEVPPRAFFTLFPQVQQLTLAQSAAMAGKLEEDKHGRPVKHLWKPLTLHIEVPVWIWLC